MSTPAFPFAHRKTLPERLREINLINYVRGVEAEASPAFALANRDKWREIDELIEAAFDEPA